MMTRPISRAARTTRKAPRKGRGCFRASIFLACSYFLWLIVFMSSADLYFESMQTKGIVAFEVFFNKDNSGLRPSPQIMTTTVLEDTVVQEQPFIKDLLRKAGIKEMDLPTVLSLFQGREPLIDLLQEAGAQESLDLPTILSLPKWSSVTKLYGEGPVVIGLDTCEQFRNTVPPDDAYVAPAGLFNTATNTLAEYMLQNMEFPDKIEHPSRGGTRWQVPWGKHMPLSRKNTNTVESEINVNKTNVMPIVLVRDPYSWMQSVCKNPYQLRWNRTSAHCPNLVVHAKDLKNDDDDDLIDNLIEGMPVPVTVKHQAETYDSLVHYWSKWYRDYYEADFPRLMVRFEDLQYHPKEILEIVRTCVGAAPKNSGQFQYVVNSGKSEEDGHQESQTNLISAMIKYGTDKKRFLGLTKEDLEFAKGALDSELMQLFQYEMPP